MESDRKAVRGERIGRLNRMAGVSAGILLVATASEARAQTADAATGSGAEGFTLEEVVVTSERRSENLQKVAIAVTAIDGEELQRTGISDPRSVLQDAPSMRMASWWIGGAASSMT